jgi:hypothetical protein
MYLDSQDGNIHLLDVKFAKVRTNDLIICVSFTVHLSVMVFQNYVDVVTMLGLYWVRKIA